MKQGSLLVGVFILVNIMYTIGGLTLYFYAPDCMIFMLLSYIACWVLIAAFVIRLNRKKGFKK